MKRYSMKLSCFFGVLVLCNTYLHAQDTLHITLPEAEKQFVQKNLQLLAAHYNIDIAKAAVVQARLYNNPTLSFDASLYDPDRKKVFNVSNRNGQYDASLQQVIILASKRNKAIKMSETAVSLNESAFYDLLRTLRYSLRSNFYDIYFLQNSINSYSAQVVSLEKLNTAYEQLQVKGVVTMKDALRIKSLLYSLKTEQASLQNQLNDLEASFQLLVQNNKTWFIAKSSDEIPAAELINNLNLQGLIDTAYENRPDLLSAQRQILYEQQNFNYQKAMAVPDVTLGASFDKRGSFVDNASFLTVAIDLPFFKRNQGNIKAARFNIEQSKTVSEQQKQFVENDVQRAYSKLLSTHKMLQSIDPDFHQQYENMMSAITDNFQKKNISLVEFTDFHESYRQNVIQYNQLKDQEMQAIESLHFALGKTIFNN